MHRSGNKLLPMEMSMLFWHSLFPDTTAIIIYPRSRPAQCEITKRMDIDDDSRLDKIIIVVVFITVFFSTPQARTHSLGVPFVFVFDSPHVIMLESSLSSFISSICVCAGWWFWISINAPYKVSLPHFTTKYDSLLLGQPTAKQQHDKVCSVIDHPTIIRCLALSVQWTTTVLQIWV